MARYMIEMHTHPHAVAALLQNPTDRGDVVRPIFEAVGGKLEQYYMSGAENKVWLVADIPDEKTVQTVLIAVFAGGAVSSIRATAVMSTAEAVGVFEEAARVAYRPPSA